jgi:hypothetical protein
MTSNDPQVKLYKETREKYKKKKIKTNLDLMEAFNETAQKFIPLYQKRVNQQEQIVQQFNSNQTTHPSHQGSITKLNNSVGTLDNDDSDLPKAPPQEVKKTERTTLYQQSPIQTQLGFRDSRNSSS